MASFHRYLTIICVMIAVAVAFRLLLDIPSWFTLAGLIIAWPLVGTLITIGDDLPGGWSNLDGKSVPEWRRLWWWADLLLVRGALVVGSFAAEQALAGRFFIAPLVTALVMASIGLPLLLRGIRRDNVHAI
ncbi:MAG: hypothetical protein ABUS47_12095 [Steroidobacter sp.]